MALGNGNPKQGDKGSNWSYEFKSLTQLKNIKDAIDALIALTETAQDYEAKIVVDANEDTWQEVRIYNPDTGTWETPKYARPGDNTFYELGDPGGPVAPLVYINPNTFLAQIVSNTTGLNLEATQLLVKAVLDVIQTNTLNTANGITTANTSLNDIENELIALNNTAGTLSLEATQLLVKAVLDAIKLDTANLDVALSTRATEATQLLNNTALLNIFAQLDVDLSTRASEATLSGINTKLTPAVITPSIIRATGAGTIAAGAYSFSVANVGSLSGILLGVTIKPGEVINFDAGSLNNTYGAVSYDGTGTELLITVNS